jgi:hypothetical protein
MTGDAANTAQWAHADVFVASLGAAPPTDVTTAWGVAWEAVGLLDGDQGFTEQRSDDSNEKYAWGGLLVRRTKFKHKRQIKFVCLEDNDVTFGLLNPGSTRTEDSPTVGITQSVIKVPQQERIALGFEVRDGSVVRRRLVKNAEVVDIADVKDSESDVTAYEVTVVIYPEADGTLYTDLIGAVA